MFTTKKDIDRHVRTAFSKLRTENEKNLRGYTAAKMYYKIGEYQSAQHYVSAYISVKKDNAAAYRLLGKCCVHLKKVENALEAYQKSIQLDPNQPDLVVEVSKVLLSDESNLNSSKIKFWEDLVMRYSAFPDESVLNLRFKLMSRSNSSELVEDVLVKEIMKKPLDVNLRIRLLKQLLEKKKVAEAFKYVNDIEIKHHSHFVQSLEWYNTVALVLSTYKLTNETNSVITNKDFCCLYLNALERQIYLNLVADSALSSVRSGNLVECVRILFELDQFLYQFSQANIDLRAEVGIQLVNYFRGQLCLHTATLLFKRDFTGNEWQDAIKCSLVLLLHAYQCGILEIPDTMVRQVPEVMKHLMDQWQNQSAFRCLQAGRTLLSTYDEQRGRPSKASDRSQQLPYGNREELLMNIRGKCSNSSWKQGLFKLLFKASDQISAIGTSYLTTCASLTEPLYELPTANHVESNEKASSLLNPFSLAHQVYVRLKTNTLWECDFNGFECLNMSMSNLINCAPSTLNQLDVESFLYAVVIQTRRELELVQCRNQSGLPGVLPFANIMGKMCSDDQANWWTAAYKITTNGTAEDVPKIRSTVQDGLEVIRCVGNPRMDAMIALKVGQTLQDRLDRTKKSAERNYIENRVEIFYRYAVRQLKRYPNGSVVSTRKLFKYSPSPEPNPHDDLDVELLATNAVNFLGKLYIERERYEECVEELNESNIEGADFFVGEANKKLAASKTPQRESTTTASGECSSIDSNYIKRLVQAEVRKIQMQMARSHEESEYDFLSDEDALHGESGFSRPRRSVLSDNTQQLQLIQQMTTLLSNLQLDFSEVKKELCDVKGQLATLQETVETKVIHKDSAASVLEDIYRLDDEETRRQQELSSAVPTDYFGNLYNAGYPMYGYYPGVSGSAAQLLQQQLQRNVAMGLHQIPTTVSGGVNLYPDAASLAINPQSPQILQRQIFDSTMRLQQSLADQASTAQLLYPGATSATAKVQPNSSFITGTTSDQYSMANSVVKTWNSTFNNAPVEKLPPVNVVITSSDPLPTHTTISAAPPLLSVTIPPQHIKQSAVVPELSAITPPNVDPTQKSHEEIHSSESGAQDDAELRALKASDEEGEIVRFSGAAKLFHSQEKELIECGLGDLKIFQNKKDLKKYRIFMRRDQGNKVCANHVITPEMEITSVKNKDKSFSWTATDLVQGTLRSIKFFVKFKTLESSTEFKNAFEKVKVELGMKEAPKDIAQDKSQITANPLTKAVTFNFGGFNTNSVTSTANSEADDKKIGPNPFSGFTFGKSNDGEGEKKFPNLFSGFTTSGGDKNSSALGEPRVDTSLNRSGDGEEDEYVSTAQFQPVIPLPKLVDVKTGEENETVLFEHRAKLLRFDKEAKEWKERGIGNMKVLVNAADVSKVRLLMRREQVFKLCCNQMVTDDLKFTKMPNTESALSWYGQDFSDNEVKTEMFAIRFKTAEICKNFHDAVLKAQAGMKGGDKAATEKKETDLVASLKAGFGDAFKPKTGQWECKECLLRNAADVSECVACQSPKETAAAKNNTKGWPSNFCVPPPDTTAKAPAAEPTVGFGDKFKPKAGTWECKGCFIFNQSDALYCVACDSPKDDTVPKKNQGLDLTTQSKFVFGMPPTTTSSPAISIPATTVSTTTAPPAVSTFTFGIKPTTTTGILSSTSTFSFAQTPANQEQVKAVEKTPEKPEISLQRKDTFSFVFTPKSPGKVRSPTKSTPGKDGHASDEEGIVEEENNTYFTPVIPLPDKIEVKTGEENEDVLYTHRAKLYRFADKEWKERGTGDVKILRDKTTKVLRVLMRREPILKICLNHRLTEDIEYEKKDDKSWHFVVKDFSEGELELTQLCLRFKTPEIAKGFRDAVQKALGGDAEALPNGGHGGATEVKVNGKLSVENEEEEKLRKDLKLPEKFFEYKTKADCSGCRGCKSDDFVFPVIENINLDLVDEKPIPLKQPDIPSALLKPKPMGFLDKASVTAPTTQQSSFIFGGAKSFSFGQPQSIFAPTFGDNKATTTASTALTATTTTVSSFNVPSVETQKNIFGTPAKSGESIFSGSTFSFGGTSVFGGNTFAPKTTDGGDTKPTVTTTTPFTFQTPAVTSSESSGTIFGGTGSVASTFSFATTGKNLSTPFEGSKIFGGGATTVFGQKTDEKATDEKSGATKSDASTTFSFAQLAKSPEKPAVEVGKDILKMDENLSFASLAKAGGAASDFLTKETKEGKTGFFGLSYSDDFRHFGGSAAAAKSGGENGTGNDDSNYDPHYEPLIPLPDEIKVSTGEEEEILLFNQFSNLYRFDFTNKEWKERGTGYMKILHHPVKGTYRFVMRRDQVHKLVLNHAITAEFNIAPMNKTGRSFCWAAVNYAEDPAQTENLAIRFKTANVATDFEKVVNECIQKLKEKGDLEPEED